MDCEITRVIIRMVSMIYFPSLLPKRYREILLFEIVVPLTSDARQSLATLEVKQNPKIKHDSVFKYSLHYWTPFEN